MPLLQARGNLIPYDGQLYHWPRFYPREQADSYFQRLHQNLTWQQENLFIYGRWPPVPRLRHGMASPLRIIVTRRRSPAIAMTPELQTLRLDMQRLRPKPIACWPTCTETARLMGRHADDEKEWAPTPSLHY